MSHTPNRKWTFGIVIVVAILTGCGTSPQAKEAKYLDKGKSLLAKKDYARALLEFRNAAKRCPKTPNPIIKWAWDTWLSVT
jgi:hypothetical protein